LLVPGFSIHNEIRLFTGLGLRPYEVLVLATRNAGEFIEARIPGTERFGVVEVGARADLLLLEGNPLADLARLEQPTGVMARGRWYSRADLDAILAGLP
jgi:imidazolonepropionase-like amidohydrolase